MKRFVPAAVSQHAPVAVLCAAGALAAACGPNVADEPAAAAPPAAAGLETAAGGVPARRLAEGRPDLNGTWAHAGGGVLGLEFVAPETLADGSVCLFGCADDAADAGEEGDAEGGAAADEERAAELEHDDRAEPFPPAEQTFPSYRPELQAKVDELRERQVELDTVLRCYPPGVPRIGPPGKIVQTGAEIVFLYNDYNGGFFRIVPIDGRPHRADAPPSYLGDAVGRFEGDVLVVETVNFTDETWLIDDGAFHTKDLKVIERLRRVGDTIEYEVVAEDPAVLTEPWQARVQTLWLADREIENPVPCEERDLEQMTDASYHQNPR